MTGEYINVMKIARVKGIMIDLVIVKTVAIAIVVRIKRQHVFIFL
jgi:hypothetical protein